MHRFTYTIFISLICSVLIMWIKTKKQNTLGFDIDFSSLSQGKEYIIILVESEK